MTPHPHFPVEVPVDARQVDGEDIGEVYDTQRGRKRQDVERGKVPEGLLRVAEPPSDGD